MLQYLLQHVRAFNSTSTASVNGGMTNKSIPLIYTRMVCTDAINNLGSTDGVQEAGRLGACGQQRTCMPTLAAPLGQWAPLIISALFKAQLHWKLYSDTGGHQRT